MSLKLRPYQSKLVSEIRQAYSEGYRAPLVCLSTGGGKTTIFAYVTSNAAAKGRSVFLLAHRAELVKQIADTLARFGCAHAIVAPGPIIRQCQVEQFKAYGKSFVDPGAKVLVCSAQTLVRRMDSIRLTPDLIVIDESHHLVSGNTWGNIIANYPSAKLLPVTATPIRVDGKGLGKNHGGFADTMVSGPSMRELIEGGFLSPYRIFAPPTALDMSGVKTRAGDYAKDDLANAVDKPVITGSAVEHYLKLASGKRAVAFCVSVEHAMHVAAQFRENGIPAEHLDGTMDAMERDRKIKAFSAGETLVLTSADLISEGFDLPAIEVAILLRPTQSLSLYLQQVGRALRTFPGKSEAIILDHVNSTMRHGLIDEEREWSLEGKKKSAKKQSDDEDDVKVKCCPECFAVHEPAPACPVCGHVYEIKAKKLEVVDGSLSEITKSQMEAMRKSRMIQQGKAQSVEALVAQGMSRFRAEKIIEARLAKQTLQQEIFDKLDKIMVKTGFGPYATCGFTRSDVLRMKPKQLKELSATITTVNYKELQ